MSDEQQKPDYDTFEANRLTAEMWLALARQIADAIPDLVINDKPATAVRWATCAEACFWKATGEADAHDVKEILEQISAEARQ